MWTKANPGVGDPLPSIATDIARETKLLILDEFQVTDIADAMILKRLFSHVLEAVVFVIAPRYDLLYTIAHNMVKFCLFKNTSF